MGIITSMRRQKAVYWAPRTNPAGDIQYTTQGQVKYDTGVEISCRWENTKEEFIGPEGTPRISQAKVYVDRDVLVGGYLRLGTLASVDFADDPLENDNILEILSFTKMPNLRNTEVLRTCML